MCSLKFAYYLVIGVLPLSIFPRSIHRPVDNHIPEITTRWLGETKTYSLKDSHLDEHALFKKFDKEFLLQHLLPREQIVYRHKPDKSVDGTHLSNLIEELIVELQNCKEKKTSFKNFIVLKQRDFNARTCSGLIILKFKDYPFVVKLFMETPQSFVDPFSKGFEASCLFIMGSSTRYLSGFIRIKNLEAIRERIKTDSYWSKMLDTPRKWYWQPSQPRWFEVRGTNIGKQKTQVMVLPSVYAIICDEIESDSSLRLLSHHNRRLAMQLSHFLGNRIDPHIDNFMIEKPTGKIILVDTEHFATMVGFRKNVECTGYSSWYCKLCIKFMADKFGRSKNKRRAIHHEPVPEVLLC